MELHLEVRIVDETGRTHAAIRRDLPREAAYMGKRVVDEIKAGVYWDPASPSPLEAVAKVMKVREVRRKVLAEEAMHAGHQIANFLQDREGWHGADRSEAAERALQPSSSTDVART